MKLCELKLDWSPDVTDPCPSEAVLHAHLDDDSTAWVCAVCFLAIVVDGRPLILRRGGVDLRTIELVHAHDSDLPCTEEAAA